MFWASVLLNKIGSCDTMDNFDLVNGTFNAFELKNDDFADFQFKK